MVPNPHPIPAFYRIFFTSIDPLIALSAAYMSFFDQHTIIASQFPLSHEWARLTPSHAMLMHQAGGAFAMMAFLMLVMLRCTHDETVWKLFECGVLITDFALFYSLWSALEAQGRLDVAMIRAEEWGTVAITGFVTVVRVLFVAGFGFGRSGSHTRKKAK